jgi:SRSO17 transposase
VAWFTELAGSIFRWLCQEDAMERIELRAVAGKLTKLHGRFEDHFGRVEAREHSRSYLRGLLLTEGRKSVEPMALLESQRLPGEAFEQSAALAIQRFLTVSPWEAWAVQREIQAVFAEEFVPSGKEWAIGTVGVVDESGFEKRGHDSVGVQRQWCGRLGKVENCQVGVFLVGVTPEATVLLDHQLFLPESWAKDRPRRRKVRVPESIRFQSKPEIATALLQRTEQHGLVRFDWLIADEEYGRNGTFLDDLERRQQRYLMEVPADTTVWTLEPTRQTPDDTVRSVRDLAGKLPEKAWQVLKLRDGARGPLVFQFARLRVWAMRHRQAGPAIWLVFRRPLDPQGEIKYYVSNAPEETPLGTLALVSGCRWRVEEFLEDAKGYLGMADYEARSWTSWHHHMSLVALAHLFVQQTRQELRGQTPELTLDMAIRLLKSAFQRPVLSPDDAIQLVEYHLHRNRIARESHHKSWKIRHKKVKTKVML